MTLSAAVDWRSSTVPFGVSVHVSPAQFHLGAPSAEHLIESRLLAGYVADPFELLGGLAATSNGLICVEDANFAEDCAVGAGISLAGRIRIGRFQSHHLTLRGAFPLVTAAQGPHFRGRLLFPAVGGSVALGVSERLQLFVDGGLRLMQGAHLDGGIKLHLAEPGAVGTLAFSLRLGWQLQMFQRVTDPQSYSGPRMLVASEWSL